MDLNKPITLDGLKKLFQPKKKDNKPKPSNNNNNAKKPKNRQINPAGIGRKAIVKYSYTKKGHITVYLYMNNVLEAQHEVSLRSYQIEKGIVSNLRKLRDTLKDVIGYVEGIYLLLEIKETFKTTISLPKTAFYKSKVLFNKELELAVPDYKDKYIHFKEEYVHQYGSINYVYFVPKEIVEQFETLAYQLETRLMGVDLFERHLYKVLSKKDEDLIIHYYEKDIVSLIIGYSTTLVGFVTFVNTPEDFLINNTSYIDKHFYTLENKRVEKIISNENEELRVYDEFKFFGE